MTEPVSVGVANHNRWRKHSQKWPPMTTPESNNKRPIKKILSVLFHHLIYDSLNKSSKVLAVPMIPSPHKVPLKSRSLVSSIWSSMSRYPGPKLSAAGMWKDPDLLAREEIPWLSVRFQQRRLRRPVRDGWLMAASWRRLGRRIYSRCHV